MMTMHANFRLSLIAAAALGLHGAANAVQPVIKDTLTDAQSIYDWVSLNGACLTAGNGKGAIPACVGLPYYGSATLVGGTTGRLPDLAGSGALRLTNGAVDSGSGGTNQTGAVVSNFTFGTKDGIQVTWTSVSYGGNNYNGTGADGLSFFLSDGAQSPTVGALGGSLGYSCSNVNGTYDGVVGGYIGIGIDEFGNFSNQGDNTDTGVGAHAGRISVRGAGSTAWAALAADPTYGKYYKSGNHGDAIHNTCRTGYYWNYSGGNLTDSTNTSISNGSETGDKITYNYPLLKSVNVPAGIALANQQATDPALRANAIPIVFSLKITSDGLLDFSYSANGGATQTVAAGVKITDNNGPLPSSFRFGFSAGTGGGSNVHEITCFKAEPADVASTSASANVQQGQVVQGLSQVFLAFYHPVNWWGSLTANALNYVAATDTLTASTLATWDGGCNITGGKCSTMSSDPTAPVTVTLQTQARQIITYNSTGVPFAIGSLSNTQKAALGSATTTPPLTAAANQALEIAYLRGTRDNEQTNSTGTVGTMRNRTSVLGDIVDSSPVFVGAPTSNYANKFVDKLATSKTLVEGTSYASFQTTNAGRMNMIYAGSNDGLLHAFRAGTLAADGKTLTSNDGYELFAYIPSQVIMAIRPSAAGYDYSNVLYQHNFQVDGTPGMGDLYYSGNWHTWLVTGLGVGGHPAGPVNSNGVDSSGNQLIPDPVGALFALDITNPSIFTSAETSANAKTMVIGEWNSSTVTCTNSGSFNATCGTALGQVTGTPLIRRLHDGSWGVIWGNGLNSSLGRAGIFIMHIDSSGGQTLQYIDATAGPGNGIVQVTAADLDGDHITDFVYAGDVKGNLWRFDLTDTKSTAPASWSSNVTRVFTTSTGQPITTAPLVTQLPVANATGYAKVLVSFGTGQKLPVTSTSAETYASGTQSLYGVWDANMSAWNTTTTDTKYDTLTTTGQPLSPSGLVAQTVTNVTGVDGTVYRTISTNTVCWSGTTGCTSTAAQYGWKIDLPGTGEQVIYNPVQIEDSFVVNTTIPTVTGILNCTSTPPSGFTMAPDMFNGGGDNAPFSDTAKATTSTTYNSYSGIAANGSGTPTEFTTGTGANATTHLGFETTDANWKGPQFNRRGGKVTKVTWTKVR